MSKKLSGLSDRNRAILEDIAATVHSLADNPEECLNRQLFPLYQMQSVPAKTILDKKIFGEYMAAVEQAVAGYIDKLDGAYEGDGPKTCLSWSTVKSRSSMRQYPNDDPFRLRAVYLTPNGEDVLNPHELLIHVEREMSNFKNIQPPRDEPDNIYVREQTRELVIIMKHLVERQYYLSREKILAQEQEVGTHLSVTEEQKTDAQVAEMPVRKSKRKTSPALVVMDERGVAGEKPTHAAPETEVDAEREEMRRMPAADLIARADGLLQEAFLEGNTTIQHMLTQLTSCYNAQPKHKPLLGETFLRQKNNVFHQLTSYMELQEKDPKFTERERQAYRSLSKAIEVLVGRLEYDPQFQRGGQCQQTDTGTARFH